MPKTATPSFTQTIRHVVTTFNSTDGISPKTLSSGGANDSRIIHITISSDDNAANIAYFSLDNGTVSAPIGHCNVPNGSGTNGTSNIVAVLNSASFLHRKLDNNANPYFELATGWTLKMNLANSVSTGATMKVLVTLEDY